MEEPIIRLESVTHHYHAGRDNQTAALDELSLEIAAGEFVAVVGPNGSGKSTLAKHLNALLLPTKGVVRVDGLDTREPAHLWEVRRTVGMVFQNPDNQIVATVVDEDVAFGPENLGVKPDEIRSRVREALALVGMAALADRPPHLLSGGQKQRVAIAGVLAMRPRCLVLDEATAMLDPAGRDEVLATVRRLNRDEGLTVVYITHFMEETAGADRVVVLDRGQMFLEGTPRYVFSHARQLDRIGLDVPPVTALAAKLRTSGLDVPADTLTVEEMVQALCPS
ncbi:MAG: energy-coupling factor transporter ATPase [bacterium]|nr:energy-coupling factor transporter ATPase [bacterium]